MYEKTVHSKAIPDSQLTEFRDKRNKHEGDIVAGILVGCGLVSIGMFVASNLDKFAQIGKTIFPSP